MCSSSRPPSGSIRRVARNCYPLVEDLVERSRAEDGTVRYHAAEDITEPNVLRFFEQYEGAAAAEAHTGSAAYRRFVGTLPDVVEGEIETVQIPADEVEELAFTPAEAVAAID